MGNEKKRRSRSRERSEKGKDKRGKRSRSRSKECLDKYKRHRSRSRDRYDGASNAHDSSKYEKMERTDSHRYIKNEKDKHDERKDSKDKKNKDFKRRSPTPSDNENLKVKNEIDLKQEYVKKEPLSLEELLAKKKAAEAIKSKVG